MWLRICIEHIKIRSHLTISFQTSHGLLTKTVTDQPRGKSCSERLALESNSIQNQAVSLENWQ